KVLEAGPPVEPSRARSGAPGRLPVLHVDRDVAQAADVDHQAVVYREARRAVAARANRHRKTRVITRELEALPDVREDLAIGDVLRKLLEGEIAQLPALVVVGVGEHYDLALDAELQAGDVFDELLGKAMIERGKLFPAPDANSIQLFFDAPPLHVGSLNDAVQVG